jgi:hypothetical protein
MIMNIEIKSCPEGLINGKCKTENCIYQEGKWKGEDVPSLEIEASEKAGEFKIICSDETGD